MITLCLWGVNFRSTLYSTDGSKPLVLIPGFALKSVSNQIQSFGLKC